MENTIDQEQLSANFAAEIQSHETNTQPEINMDKSFQNLEAEMQKQDAVFAEEQQKLAFEQELAAIYGKEGNFPIPIKTVYSAAIYGKNGELPIEDRKPTGIMTKDMFTFSKDEVLAFLRSEKGERWAQKQEEAQVKLEENIRMSQKLQSGRSIFADAIDAHQAQLEHESDERMRQGAAQAERYLSSQGMDTIPSQDSVAQSYNA